MRAYLVIMDETDEARTALRFAADRAAITGGAVHIIALVEPQSFSAFGAVQATIEQEARDRAEAVATSAAGALIAAGGRAPSITVCAGEGHVVVREYLEAHPEIAALVLGAAKEGPPGPLVSHFSNHAGAMPCPIYIVPGAWQPATITATD